MKKGDGVIVSNPINLRVIAMITFLLAIILFLLDGFYFDHSQWFDGIGLISTFILPPVGIIVSYIQLRKSNSKYDLILIILNVIALLTFFLYMFFGTLFLGP